jgi:pilus assembly protein CpaC
MHRTHLGFSGRFCSTFVGVLAAGLFAVSLTAQDQPQKDDRAKGAIFVGVDTTKTVSMSTKKKIKSGTIDRPSIASFERDPADATIARIKGSQVGLTYLELVDENENKEIFQIIVEPDLEYVRNLVKTKVPGSNVEISAVGAGSVYVSGFVDSPESVTLIIDLVQRGLGAQVINGMRVIGVQQVQLNVVVAEVSRSKMREMSFAFQNSSNTNFISSALGLTSNVTTTAAISPAGATATASGSPSNLFLGMINESRSFWAFLQALKNENLLKLLAEPKLIALSGRQAEFLDGGQQAIPVPAGLGQVGIQYMEFGVQLRFIPTVLGNGRVRLDVAPEVSDLNAAFGTTISGTTVPGETIERVHTTVEMEVGQTYVIGGLIHHTVNATNTAVPVLGELPCIGALFSGKSYQETEDELMVMVTPYFVDSLGCDQLPQCLPGQETRSPDDFELFLEGILEAPHGLRPVKKDGHYNAAWKMSPTASIFPCGPCGTCGKDGKDCRGGAGSAWPGGCASGNCGASGGGCANGSCGMPMGEAAGPAVVSPAPPLASVPAQPSAPAGANRLESPTKLPEPTTAMPAPTRFGLPPVQSRGSDPKPPTVGTITKPPDADPSSPVFMLVPRQDGGK